MLRRLFEIFQACESIIMADKSQFNPKPSKKENLNPLHYFIKLVTVCPAASCLNDTTPTQWTHAKCGSQMEINCLANLRCPKCEIEDCILNWRFACQNHRNEYKPPDKVGLVQAITVLRAGAGNHSDRVWYRTLALSISNKLEEAHNKLEEMEDGNCGSFRRRGVDGKRKR